VWFGGFAQPSVARRFNASFVMSQKKRNILIVDDEPAIAELLAKFLQAEGHHVIYARDGLEGLERLAEQLPDLILLDLDMPRMNGFEFCFRVKSDPRTRLLPVVFLTGRSESEARMRAWALDADDFLSKPFLGVEVVARCRALLRMKDLVDELDSAQTVVFSLARAMEAKSFHTQGHSERVTAYTLALADRMLLSAAEKAVLWRGATLHDIGKIAIPDEILNKPGPLTKDEMIIVQQHCVAGVRVVEPLRSVQDAIPMIRSHHERMDGAGYPDGLVGEAIPLFARIVAVADVFDALASSRPYRGAIPVPTCIEMLQSNAANGGLDAELVRIFCQTPAIPLHVPAQSAHSGNS